MPLGRPRTIAPACLLAIALLGACGDDAGGAPAPAKSAAPPTAAQRAAAAPECADDRVAYLLASATRTEPFLADTTDTTAVLVAQLGWGQQDPLIHAKEELAALGAEALPELDRFVAAQMKDADGSLRLANAFAVLMLMKDPGAHDLCLRGLEHAQESVRLAAVRALGRHPDPRDYDRLAALLPISGWETQIELAKALHASDRARAEDDFCRWYDEGKFAATRVPLAPQMATTKRPETLAGLRALLPKATQEHSFYFRAALAASGDAVELERLRKELREGQPQERTMAVQALNLAGLALELVPVLATETEVARRALIATHLSALPDEPVVRAALQRGLSDGAREVRKLCLGALVTRGDAQADAIAIEMLQGEKADVEDALLAFRDRWIADEALARRGFAVLAALRTGEIRPLRIEARALDRAISLVPLREAGELLYASALEPGEPIAGVSRHRWYTQMIGNTGAPGALLVRERWKTEPDPVRRIDLVTAGVYEHDDASREFLVGALDDPRTTPCEALVFAADLCRRGPSARIAPLLKRHALRIEDPAVRPAFNALLWRWYGRLGT